MKRKIKKHCCKICGEKDPNKFYKGSKSICKKHHIEYSRINYHKKYKYKLHAQKTRYVKNYIKCKNELKNLKKENKDLQKIIKELENRIKEIEDEKKIKTFEEIISF